MQRPTTWIRPSLNRYRNIVIIVLVVLGITAYPLYLLSHYISDFFVIETNYRPAEEIIVNYDLDVDVYENMNSETKFSDIVIEEINKAKEEIFVAMYSFSITEIRDAIKEAADRGVKVKIIYNTSRKLNFEEFTAGLEDAFEVVYLPMFKEPDDNYHMHHKFMIIDPELDTGVLLTGPWNWSYLQEDLDPNILMKIKDPEIISAYMSEIIRLSRGNFGYAKFRDLIYIPWAKKITYASGENVEIWFSPGRKENSIETRIVDLILDARESIDIGVTIFDSHTIAKYLLDKAQNGVKVRIVVNATTMDEEDSMIPWLKNKIEEYDLENLEIYAGGTLPTEGEPEFSIFHHNNLIIDNKIVLTGTGNWTFGGFYFNDENTLIYFSPDIAEKFTKNYNEYLNYLETRQLTER